MSASVHLDPLTFISQVAAPERKKWKRRDRYKDYVSPTYASLHAQLLAIVKIQRHLGVLGCTCQTSHNLAFFSWNRGWYFRSFASVGRCCYQAPLLGRHACCSITSCIGYFELFCALLFTYSAWLALLCYSLYRSTAQWTTVYLYRQELSVIDGRFCR